MSRPTKLTPEIMFECYSEQPDNERTAEHLQAALAERYDLQVSLPTVNRAMLAYGVRQRYRDAMRDAVVYENATNEVDSLMACVRKSSQITMALLERVEDVVEELKISNPKEMVDIMRAATNLMTTASKTQLDVAQIASYEAEEGGNGPDDPEVADTRPDRPVLDYAAFRAAMKEASKG